MTQGFKQITGTVLVDPTTFAPKGLVGGDGREYLLPTLALNGSGVTTPTLDGTAIGGTTPSTVKTTNLQAAVFTDISGTPGNGTSSGTRGRAAFAAAGSTVTVTSTLVTATSTVLVQLGGADVTLTSVRVTAGAGSFTVTGNAAATGTTPFDFLVVN